MESRSSTIGIAVLEAETPAHEAGILFVSSAGKYALEIPWHGQRRVVEAELMESMFLGVNEEDYTAAPDSVFENLVNLGIEQALNIYKAAKNRGITPRQLQIAQLAALEFKNQKIADFLGISKRTVSRHLNSFYRKVGDNSRPQAARRFFEYE